MTRMYLAFPGDLQTPTGGYAYDRQVLAHLPQHGIAAKPLPLPGGFPFPSAQAVNDAIGVLEGTDPSAILLVDGLALGALPADRTDKIRGRLVALIHHPLGLEEGLHTADRQKLLASERAILGMGCPIITTSHPTARTLVADFGVDPARITVAEPGTEPLPRARADGNPPRLLAVGSVIPRKGYPILIAALSALSDLPWTLTIIGGLDFDPEEAHQVRDRIAAAGLSQRIKLFGAATPEQLARAYESADLFVHPSLYEGYGMVLAEALRRGLPLVCTTGGAAGETVPEGAGVKVPPGDAAALQGALRGLLSDADARRRLADAAFAAGRRLPSWSHTARGIAHVLKAMGERDQGTAGRTEAAAGRAEVVA